MSGLAVVIFVTTPLSYLSQQIAARLRRKLAHLSFAVVCFVRPCTHNARIAAFYRPFTSVVQKIALTAVVDQAIIQLEATPTLAKTSMAYQSHLDDPEYWRDRAEQVRALADEVSNQSARDAILRIVADYELLAIRAQERAKR
jgi:hypothetical protein